MRLPAQVAVMALLLAASSQAAYHYVHYSGRTAPFTPIFEKFNLAALPNNTVTFMVADQGSSYGPNETPGSVLSQIKQAAAAWNSVAISDLRVAFGGLEAYTDSPTPSRPGNSIPSPATPGGDVLFTDTPGLLGMGAPTISTTPAGSPNGPFFPIVRGVVMISRNSSSDPWPSYSEAFFTTAVHEIGHALGLQHTWTGSAMSQDLSRNTSRARPLDPDDIASLALLYGKSNWQLGYATIRGTVTYANANATPVSLASVVAVSPAGPAVSTLTNPDGTYRIDGLPANLTYSVYVHPLPPDAVPADNSGLRPPVDLNNGRFNPTGPFQTIFFAGSAGTLDPSNAGQFTLGPGVSATANFSVQPRASVPAYNVKTFSRIFTATRQWGNPSDAEGVGVRDYPGFIDSTQTTGLVIVQAADGVLPVPQSVTVMGGFAPATLKNPSYPAVYPYSDTPGDFIAIYLLVPPGAGLGPRHMVFNFGNDIYVLPSGVDLVRQGPPVAIAATQNPDGTVTVSGAGFGADSRVFFDGLQATQLAFNPADGSLTVTPPPGASGQTASVTVYNSDGQNSTIMPGATPPTHSYGSQGAPQIASVNPPSLPAGTSATVDIIVTNMTLVDGQVTIGFGASDVQVRRVWVLSPTQARVDVWIPANAAPGLSEVSVISGMQVASASFSFQIQPARAGAPAVASVVNAIDPAQVISPANSASPISGFVSVFGQSLATSFSSVQVSLNDVPMTVIFASPTQVNFQIPQGFPVGAATLRLISSGVSAQPVVVQIDTPAPVIAGVSTQAGAPLAGPAAPGDTLSILVTGLDPAVAVNYRSRLKATIAGMEMTIQQVSPAAAGAFQVQIAVNQSFGSAQVPLAVSADGVPSAPVNVVIR